MLQNIFCKLTFHFTHTLKISLLPAIILETISCFQIFHLFLREIFSSPVGHQLHFSDFITKLTSLSGTFDIFCSDNSFCWLFKSLCVAFVGYVLIATLLTFSILFVSNKNFKLKNTIAAVLLIHSRVIYFSSTYFFLKILARDQPYYDSEIFRWWVLIALILNFLLTLIQELFFHQITNIKNAYATTNNYFHQLVFSHKTVGLLCHFFLNSSIVSKAIASVLNVIFIILILYILYNKLPFYRIELFKISLYMISGSFGLSIIMLVKNSFSLEENLLEPLTFIFVPLLLKVIQVKFRARSNQILEGRFKTPEEAIHFCILFKKYAFNTTHPSVFLQKIPKSCLVSNGILQFHKLDLGNVTQHNDKKKYEECVYSYMVQKLEEILLKNPRAHFLAFFIAKIYIKRFSNETKALRLISAVKQQQSALKGTLKRFEYFIRKRIQQQGQQGVSLNVKSQLYMMEYFEYKKKFELAQEYIGREITHQIQFWQTMKKEKINIQTLLQESQIINGLFNKIQYIFDQQLFANQVSCCISYILYAVYLQLVRGFPEDPRLLKKFLRLRKDSFLRHMLDIYTEGTAAIITFAQVDRVDRVLDISGSTHTFFGVHKSHIVGNSIRSLFPSVFVKQHIQFLQDFIKSSDSQARHKYTTCAKSHNGDLFEVEIEARLCHTSKSDGLGIMQIFRKIGRSKSMMIVGHDGGILECSKNVMESLHLELKDVNSLKLHNLCPYFYVVNNAFNVTQSTTGRDHILSSSIKRTLTQQLSPRRSYLPMDTLCRLIESPRSPLGKPSEMDCGSPLLENSIMAEDKEKEICESYQRGNKLKLWIAVDENNPRVEVECDVMIVPHILDGRVFKVLTFQNIEMSIKSQLKSLSSKKEVSVALIVPKRVEMNQTRKTSLFIQQQQTLSPQAQVNTDIIETEEIVKEGGTCLSSTENRLSDNLQLSKLRMQANSQAQGSIHSSTTEKARCIKALHVLFDQKESFGLARKFLWVVYFLGLVNVGMVTINFVYSRTSVHEIRDGIDINKTANLRLCAAMIAWEQVSRILIRGQGVKTSNPTSVATIKSGLEGYRIELVQENEELSRKLSLYTIEDLIEEMFERDLNFWYSSVNDTYSSREINVFTGNDIIANNFKAVYRMSYSDIFTPVGLGILGQAVNITANDYLVKSEELIEITQNLLYKIISDNLVALKAILGGEFFIFGIFIVMLCLTARRILSNQKLLVDILRKTDYNLFKERLEKLNEMKILLGEDIENEEGISKILRVLHKSSSSRVLVKNDANEESPNRRMIKSREYTLTVTRLVLILVKYILIAIVTIMVVSGSFLESLFDSISYFNSVERINTQIGVVSRGKYQISALTSSFYVQAVYTNNTDTEQMLVRNKEPGSQVKTALSFFGGLNSRLLDAFSEEENLDGVIRNLLQNTVCKYLTNFDQTECELGTFGNKMGVLEMNLYFSNMVKGYVQRFNTEPTMDIGKSIIEVYHVTLRNTIDTLENTYEFMINYVIGIFKQEAEEFLSRKVTRFVVILGIILASTLVIQISTVRKFEELERGRGKILKLVPLDFIETNKILSLYLKREFNHKGQVLLNWI